jgi:hypothetical protein
MPTTLDALYSSLSLLLVDDFMELQSSVAVLSTPKSRRLNAKHTKETQQDTIFNGHERESER